MRVVAVVNQKGGVGKTTVTLGLASAAYHRGRRCVVVDLDPQANATTGLAVWEAERTIDDALASEEVGSLSRCLTRAGWPDRDGGRVPLVVAGTPRLAAREPLLASDPVGAQDRLAVAMAGLQADLVLVDCPPSLGLLTVNGLFAATDVLVVTEPAAWSRDGLAQMLSTVERISLRRREPLRLGGVVVNKITRTRDASYWLTALREELASKIVAEIPMRAALAEAAAQALPVHALGNRPGAPEAARLFEDLLETVSGSPPALSPDEPTSIPDAPPSATDAATDAPATGEMVTPVGADSRR
ncbi:MAG: chromosome partitioning protein ParA [Acidimicrobiales bacterium]|nr:MAG: chromosome partitioning protein ParA [Acidimicrobiales bacterium]